ncbi:MAG: hypothetical protein K9G41_12285 [Flavobacteriales bacterium]|nr:hypothetical protein [Flavobacteriales bacterium]
MTNTTFNLEDLKYFDVEEHPSPFYKGYYRVTGKSDVGESITVSELIFKLDKDELKQAIQQLGYRESITEHFLGSEFLNRALNRYANQIVPKLHEFSGKPTDYLEISEILNGDDIKNGDADQYDLWA